MMINRKLLIISNGGVNKDLQGYDIDIANYQRFFSKPEAGYWDFGDNGDAILCEPNKVKRKALLDYIKSENRKGPTYWVIVFVGHGYADSQGVDYLELCPDELDDDSYSSHLLKQARRIIKDARTNANSTATTFDTFSVSYIHMLAKKQMASEGIEDQIPVFSGPRCNQPPFCVVPKENRLVLG